MTNEEGKKEEEEKEEEIKAGFHYWELNLQRNFSKWRAVQSSGMPEADKSVCACVCV